MPVLNVADPEILQDEELTLFADNLAKFFADRVPPQGLERRSLLPALKDRCSRCCGDRLRAISIRRLPSQWV